MKKNFKKAIALTLALCICLSFAAFASAEEIAASGGSGLTPVSLTTTNDGIAGVGGGSGGSGVTPTKMSVIVPTALPMAMSDDGTVVTATDCKITNQSFGAVRVKSVTIAAASGWHLTAYGDKSSLAAEKVDSNQLGFALSLGGGEIVRTTTTDEMQELISAPITGCYMTGVGDLTRNAISVSYGAIVTPLSSAVNAATVANIVFVVEWDT